MSRKTTYVQFGGLHYGSAYYDHRVMEAETNDEPLWLSPWLSMEYKRDIEAAKPRSDPRSDRERRQKLPVRRWWRRWRSGAYDRVKVVRRLLARYCDVNAKYEALANKDRSWSSNDWSDAARALRTEGRRLEEYSVWIRDAAALICSDLGIFLADIEDQIFDQG